MRRMLPRGKRADVCPSRFSDEITTGAAGFPPRAAALLDRAELAPLGEDNLSLTKETRWLACICGWRVEHSTGGRTFPGDYEGLADNGKRNEVVEVCWET